MHTCTPARPRRTDERHPNPNKLTRGAPAGRVRVGGWLGGRRKCRYTDADVLALAVYLSGKPDVGWLNVVALDGLQRLILKLAEHASTTGEACCFNAVANDHNADGPGHHWTSVYVRIGAKNEEEHAIGELPAGMTLNPEVRPHAVA